MKKTITLMGDEHNITQSFEKSMCVMKTGTRATNTQAPYDTIDINFGDIVHDFNVLESSSVIFKINPNDEHYYVTMFGIMFAPIESDLDKKVKKLNEIENEINALNTEHNEILDTIKRTDNKKISF